jgi:hypothetical protein
MNPNAQVQATISAEEMLQKYIIPNRPVIIEASSNLVFAGVSRFSSSRGGVVDEHANCCRREMRTCHHTVDDGCQPYSAANMRPSIPKMLTIHSATIRALL